MELKINGRKYKVVRTGQGYDDHYILDGRGKVITHIQFDPASCKFGCFVENDIKQPYIEDKDLYVLAVKFIKELKTPSIDYNDII